MPAAASVACVLRYPPAAGSKCRVSRRVGLAPAARAATAYSRSRSIEDDRAHAAGHHRPAKQREDRQQQHEDRRAREHERHHRAQRERRRRSPAARRRTRRSARAAYRAGLRRIRDAADERADQRGEERREYAERQRRARSMQQPREAIPPERIGAEQQQRRTVVGIGGDEHASAEPAQRHVRRAVFLEPSLETADDPQRMHMRRGDCRRRRVCASAARTADRRSADSEDSVRATAPHTRRAAIRPSSTAPARPHASRSSRTRGSATASRRSPSNVPNARKPAPAAAHADTR